MRAPRRLDLFRKFLLLLRDPLLFRLCELRVVRDCLPELFCGRFCERFCVFLDDDFLCETCLLEDGLGDVRVVEALVSLTSRPERRSERKLFRPDTTPWLPRLGLIFRRLFVVLLLLATVLSELRDITAARCSSVRRRRGRRSSLRSLFLIRSLLRRLGLESLRLSLTRSRASLRRSFVSLRRSSNSLRRVSLRRSSARRFLFILRLSVLARVENPRLPIKLRPSKLPPITPNELKPP